VNRSIFRAALLGLACTITSLAVVNPPAQAADTDVVISELMYQPATELDSEEFLEITNTGTAGVDISGWCFGGITFCFPAATTIPAGARWVVSPDPARTLATYGATTAGTYTGSLKNSGEAITLKNAGGTTVDTVSYLDVAPWPVTPDGLGPSLELIDPTADNNLPRNWAAATNNPGHTAGTANSVAGAIGPELVDLAAAPARPAANEAVTVTAHASGATTVTVYYRVDYGTEQNLAMTTTDNATYTATLPGVAAGHLLRYRVVATNGSGQTALPRLDDSVGYQGVVAAHGVNTQIPVMEWFIAPADYTAITGAPTADLHRPSVLAVDGVVFDNVDASIKGQSSQEHPKPSWKLEFPHNHDFMMAGLIEPVDEFAFQADWGDRARGKAYLAWETARLQKLANMQMFPIRVQRNGAFQGLYKFQEQFDGTWRDREGRGDDEVYKASSGAFVTTRKLFENRFEKKEGDALDYANLEEFLDAIIPENENSRQFTRENVDIPEMINFAAFVAIVKHVDSRNKNFYFARESHSQRWEAFPWDLDLTWATTCCGVTSTFITATEPGDDTNKMLRVIMSDPVWREMYFRRLRTVVDQVYPAGVLEGWYDARFAAAAADSNLDFQSWPYSGTYTYAQLRNQLFSSLATRRSQFAADTRIPSSQAADANVVISELAVTPTAGDTAQFVELANPTSGAIDVSGWTLSGAVTATLQQGVVIPAGGAVSIVANDPAFRASYSGQTFVGDRFSGALATGETLTLTRTNGSVADEVTFGGDGWPTATNGQTLSLNNLADDNGDGANWSLSDRPGGTPSAANNSPDTAVVPGAPQMRLVSPGNGQAIVRWRAPFTDGGAAITSYSIQARNSAGAAFGAPVVVPGTVRLGTVTGLTNGQGYTFVVQAINRVGTGANSAASTAVTPSATVTVPGAPTTRTPTAGAAGGITTAKCAWNAASVTGGSPVTGYRCWAYRMSSTANNAYVVEMIPSAVMSASSRSFEFELREGFYRFAVEAINAVGTSARSARTSTGVNAQ
jgi:hypothetical protein